MPPYAQDYNIKLHPTKFTVDVISVPYSILCLFCHVLLPSDVLKFSKCWWSQGSGFWVSKPSMVDLQIFLGKIRCCTEIRYPIAIDLIWIFPSFFFFNLNNNKIIFKKFNFIYRMKKSKTWWEAVGSKLPNHFPSEFWVLQHNTTHVINKLHFQHILKLYSKVFILWKIK